MHPAAKEAIRVPQSARGSQDIGASRGGLGEDVYPSCVAARIADFLEQLWCFCNTLTISKESPTAERIAWLAAQSIQRIGGACHEHRWFEID